MSAPASVPQEMIVATFHHSPPPASSRWPSTAQVVRYVSAMLTTDVSQTSEVSGFSKSIRSVAAYRRRVHASFAR